MHNRPSVSENPIEQTALAHIGRAAKKNIERGSQVLTHRVPGLELLGQTSSLGQVGSLEGTIDLIERIAQSPSFLVHKDPGGAQRFCLEQFQGCFGVDRIALCLSKRLDRRLDLDPFIEQAVEDRLRCGMASVAMQLVAILCGAAYDDRLADRSVPG